MQAQIDELVSQRGEVQAFRTAFASLVAAHPGALGALTPLQERLGLPFVAPRSRQGAEAVAGVLGCADDKGRVIERAIKSLGDQIDAAEKRNERERADEQATLATLELAEREESEKILRLLTKAGVKVAAPSKGAKP